MKLALKFRYHIVWNRPSLHFVVSLLSVWFYLLYINWLAFSAYALCVFFHFNNPFFLSYQFPIDMRCLAKYANEIVVFLRCDVNMVSYYKKVNTFLLTSVCFALQRHCDDRSKRVNSLPRMNQTSASDRCIPYYHVNSSTIKYLFCILDFKGFSAMP